MFNFDIGRMIVGIALMGAVVGGAIVALVLLAWPWLWALAKPALHAWTA
ncbi:hypothetical protein ACQ4WP_03315 [Janthinobacterium sp. GB4P2]